MPSGYQGQDAVLLSGKAAAPHAKSFHETAVAGMRPKNLTTDTTGSTAANADGKEKRPHSRLDDEITHWHSTQRPR
jgi:hypothetical protein